jgi:iron complex transport system ATP-binding protein
MPPVFDLRNLQFSYTSKPVLRDISMTVSSGEFLAFIGPNGAGKSTLLKILSGVIRGYSGLAEFHGTSLAGYGPADLAKRVAFVPQETHMVFPFTVGEIVMMGRLPHRSRGNLFDTPKDGEWVRRAMGLTDITSLAERTFNELSGGERQRTVLASALAQDPEILLLDEPTSHLDLKHQIQFYDILERLNRERQMTVVTVTHDINLAARYAQRVIAIRDGIIAADGRPDTVLTPEHLYDVFEIAAAVLERPDGRGNYIIPTA